MKKLPVKPIIAIIFLTVFLLSGVFWLSQKKTQTVKTILPVNFFIPERFWYGVNKNKDGPKSPVITAAVVPHHLLAGQLISGIFQQLTGQNVEKIILISPNHFEAGGPNIQFNDTDWQTPLGKVEGVHLLNSLPQATPEAMVKEHGVSGILPYIALYLPKAKVFSVIIKHKTPKAELSELAKNIAKNLDNKTILLASVDFSHYLPVQVADQRDALTKQALLNMDSDAVYGLSNDYMDSPGSIIVLLKVCQLLGAKSFSIKDHTNSANILNDINLSSTTSYFTGYCGKN